MPAHRGYVCSRERTIFCVPSPSQNKGSTPYGQSRYKTHPTESKRLNKYCRRSTAVHNSMLLIYLFTAYAPTSVVCMKTKTQLSTYEVLCQNPTFCSMARPDSPHSVRPRADMYVAPCVLGYIVWMHVHYKVADGTTHTHTHTCVSLKAGGTICRSRPTVQLSRADRVLVVHWVVCRCFSSAVTASIPMAWQRPP